MAIVHFQGSNSLRFVDRNKYSTTKDNDINNRLTDHLIIRDKLSKIPLLKVQKSDGLWFQFITDYPNFNLFLYAENAINSIALTAEFKETFIDANNNSLSIYQCDIPISSLSDGCYFVRFNASVVLMPIVEFWSEKFELYDEIEDSLKISWTGNRSYFDGMSWSGDLMNMRVDGRIFDFKPDGEQITYEDASNSLNTVASFPKKVYTVDFEQVPFWMYAKLDLALKHDEFYINDIGVNRSEKIELESKGKTLTFSGQVDFYEKNYEDNTQFTELTGDTPAIEGINLFINNTDKLLYNSTTGFNVQGNNRIYQLSEIDYNSITNDLYLCADKENLTEAEKVKLSNLKYSQETVTANLVSFTSTPNDWAITFPNTTTFTSNLKKIGSVISGNVKYEKTAVTYGNNSLTLTISLASQALDNFKKSYCDMNIIDDNSSEIAFLKGEMTKLGTNQIVIKTLNNYGMGITGSPIKLFVYFKFIV